MATTSTPTDSPVHTAIQPLHHPSQAAHIAVPQAPLGNATNGLPSQVPGMGAKALLAKKLAKNSNPTYISPTDNMLTPCSKKITATKKKHFAKGAKPMASLFATQEQPTVDEDEVSPSEDVPPKDANIEVDDDDENPF